MKIRAIKNVDNNVKGYLKYILPEIYACAFLRVNSVNYQSGINCRIDYS